jgi:hypothetical protein
MSLGPILAWITAVAALLFLTFCSLAGVVLDQVQL